MKIGIIGAGSMGSAIVKGFHKSKHIDMKDIYIKTGKSDKAKVLAQNVNAHLIEDYQSIKDADMIILVVPNNEVKNILENLSDIINKDTTIVSVVPSISIEGIENMLPEKQPIVSLLPNTVVEINEGIIGYINNPYVDEEKIITVFKPLGKLIKINQNEVDIFSTISGCGPAFVDLFIEGLSDGAVLKGMNRALSYEVITEMIIGAAKLAKKTKKHPGILKDEVTSPGGSTIKAINTLEKHAFRYALSDAIDSVNRREK
ncbi:pyrroline-5-carboxylate reductase [Staphylococcus sp. EG-SA-13]|nr:pyrroline-5-carboxylate reductase [Staphylococcus sp. EG-SA-13]